MKVSKFIFGLTAGIVGGLAVASLTAPQSGQQLRNTLKTNSTHLRERIADTRFEANNVKQSINEFTSVAKNNIPQIVNELKETLQRFQKEIEPSKQNLQQEISVLQQSIGEIEKNVSELKEKTQK
ncbi:hypothetical protein GCM10007425_17150 [Lysinibacillus alkalisoli]|uniref:YtxH domain-containing protein n=1 Tax=Lysinibacillus alkalisoli TaxID=1911548 RepID=A0A917LGS8_9BACI|nr:YtxH domain-containing protein [Lysinibacillus alkalisoli]GGG23193.1 hypothetical protein GCM10007425_17150 [Lysinibacillus alkalisoli]